MMDKRALILPGDLVEKIDANRGDLSRADFVAFMLKHLLQETPGKEIVPNYVTQQDLQDFEYNIRSFLRSFLDFFITYGLELGVSSKGKNSSILEQKLKDAAALIDKPSTINHPSPTQAEVLSD